MVKSIQLFQLHDKYAMHYKWDGSSEIHSMLEMIKSG